LGRERDLVGFCHTPGDDLLIKLGISLFRLSFPRLLILVNNAPVAVSQGSVRYTQELRDFFYEIVHQPGGGFAYFTYNVVFPLKFVPSPLFCGVTTTHFFLYRSLLFFFLFTRTASLSMIRSGPTETEALCRNSPHSVFLQGPRYGIGEEHVLPSLTLSIGG